MNSRLIDAHPHPHREAPMWMPLAMQEVCSCARMWICFFLLRKSFYNSLIEPRTWAKLRSELGERTIDLRLEVVVVATPCDLLEGVRVAQLHGGVHCSTPQPLVRAAVAVAVLVLKRCSRGVRRVLERC